MPRFTFLLSLLFLASCTVQANDSLESRLVAKNDSYWYQKILDKKKEVKQAKLQTEYSLKNQRLAGVMIENSRPSRIGMQGLSQAKIVYEALAEGGVTRFFALFPYNKKSLTVGPVRSVRDYYLDWAEEYGIPLVHAGGSPTALQRIYSKTNILNIDESDDGTTLRDKRYQRPHNLFVRLDKVFERDEKQQFKSQREITFTKKQISLPFKNTGVNISYWDSVYAVEYQYDALSRKYLRWNGGVKHIDHFNEKQIAVDNILIQIIPYNLRNGDEKNRLDMATKTSGDCWYLARGMHQACTWQYLNGRTQFMMGGKEITFVDGNVWIEVIDKRENVEVKEIPAVPVQSGNPN